MFLLYSYFSRCLVQCAAVSTKYSLINEPPQNQANSTSFAVTPKPMTAWSEMCFFVFGLNSLLLNHPRNHHMGKLIARRSLSTHNQRHLDQAALRNGTINIAPLIGKHPLAILCAFYVKKKVNYTFIYDLIKFKLNWS